MSIYLSLFLFIASVLAGLALMVIGKNMPRDRFLLLTSIHTIFLFAFVASLLLKRRTETVVDNYFFTAFICSGLILSGLSWRSDSPKALRIYYSLFILTIPMFLISPSMLLNFLTTINFSSSNGPVFYLKDNYFLESQARQEQPLYKLIQKKGIFHQSVQRDISFGGRLDSVRVLDFEKDSCLIRGFTSTASNVSLDVDSVDVKVMLHVRKPGDVEYRL